MLSLETLFSWMKIVGCHMDKKNDKRRNETLIVGVVLVESVTYGETKHIFCHSQVDNR